MISRNQQNTQNAPIGSDLASPPLQLPEQDSLDLGEFINIFYRRRWVILLGAIAIFALGMFYTLRQRQVYESTGSILVLTSASKQTAKSDDPIVADLQALTEGKSLDTQVEILSSNDFLQKAFTKLSVDDRLQGFGSETYDGDWVKIANKKGTDIVMIKASAYTPNAAKALVDSLATTCVQEELEQNRAAVQSAKEFVGKTLQHANADFKVANQQQSDFVKQHGVVSPDTQITATAGTIASLESQLTNAKLDEAATEKSLGMMRQQYQGMPEELVTARDVSENPRASARIQRIDALYSQRAQSLQEFTATSPEIVKLDNLIKYEEEELRKITQTIVSSMTKSRNGKRDDVMTAYANKLADQAASNARAQATIKVLDGFKKQLLKLPDEQRRYAEVTAALDLQKQTVQTLTEELQALQISEQSIIPGVRILSRAQPATEPIFPNLKTSAVFFLLLGIILGFGFGIVAERLDDRIHDQETAERITGLVTLGVVHAIAEDEPKIIPTDDKKSQLLERFRVLRNNISFSALERDIRLIAITSTGPGEGKSTCCANLGIVMAKDGKRILVVDCDLHRPAMHTLLHAPRSTGFTNVVMGTATLEEAIAPSDFEGLSFLPAGTLPPNPSEVLNAQPSRQLFKKLAEMYDYVILDCSPCAKLSDVQVIATIVDGVILLVGANQAVKKGVGVLLPCVDPGRGTVDRPIG